MKTTGGQSQRRWIAEVDCLRGFAILAVIAIHASAHFTAVKELNALVMTNVAIDVFCQFAVPLFVLLSGFVLALRYRRIDSIWSFYGRRARAIFPPYLVFSLLYLLLSVVRGMPLTLRGAVFAVATASSAFHLWFIAVILQLHLLYPMLVVIYRCLDRNRALLFLAGAWLVQIAWNVFRIGVLDSAPFHEPVFLDRIFASYLFCFAVGIAIGMQPDPVRRYLRGANPLWLGAAIALLAAMISLSWIVGLARYGSFYGIPSRYFLLSVLLEPILHLSTGWVLFRVSGWLVRTESSVARLVRSFGQCSLGVYLIHVFYSLLLSSGLRRVGITPDDWAFYPLLFAGVAVLSLASVKALSCLPHSEFIVGVRHAQLGRWQGRGEQSLG